MKRSSRKKVALEIKARSERAIMGTRTLDLRPTEAHGQHCSPATGPVGSSPRRSRSLGRIITPWLGVVLAALCVGAAVGPLPAAAATAAPQAAAGAHRQATAKPTATSAATPTCAAVVPAKPYSWMADIAPCIINRRLTDIVIPGSHDSVTHSFDPNDLIEAIARTQSVDLYGQLDSGARQLDIRVGYTQNDPDGYFGQHGILFTVADSL